MAVGKELGSQISEWVRRCTGSVTCANAGSEPPGGSTIMHAATGWGRYRKTVRSPSVNPSWKVDVEHTPAPDFTRWYMSRVTCGILLEVCQRCKVCSNLVAHLQIPRMRISYQVAMPVVGKPEQHAVPRRPDGAFGEALLSQSWCPRQVLQMPRERSQPQVQEIPLALRQSHAIVLPVASPLLQDHDAVRSLHFYFLLARTSLSDVEVGHLTSPNRLVFGSAPIPKLPTKRPRQQPPTSLAALVSCLQRCRPMAPAMPKDPSRVSGFVLVWTIMGTGAQNPKRQSPNHFT